MKLPFIKKDLKKAYFLTLLLRDEKISAVIFAEKSQEINIIGKQEFQLEAVLENISNESLAETLDKVISSAEEKLPPDNEVQNTIFGVKDSWVTDKKIKKEYLVKLKHLCEQLSLTPIGFIVLSEAIAHLIQQEEGAPVTALLTEVGKYTVTVSLFRAGKLIETKQSAVSGTPMQAVDDALKEFELVEILPSRLILFHSTLQETGQRNDELAQQFIAHQWSKSLPFLHVPQISILPPGFDGKAMVAGAATQLGFSIASLPHDIETKDIEDISTTETKETKTVNEDSLTHTKTVASDTTSDDFGFVINKDIAAEQVKPLSSTKTNSTSEIDDDMTRNVVTPDTRLSEERYSSEVMEEKEHAHDKSGQKSNLLSRLLFFKPMLRNIHLPDLPKLPFRNSILFIPPIILIILIGLALLYFFQLKATVVLNVTPKAVEETEKITLSTANENNFSQNIIATKEITIPVDGSVSTDTNGSKDVGNKAKGTVTIYNSGDTTKILKEGTTVISENGLNYTLDKDVTVASASGDIFTGIKSGTGQGAITASKIGTEYNLPSNTKFSIADSNVIAAKNEAALSGGSKKKVTIVTKKDTDKLLEELPKNLEQKAKDQLQGKITSDEIVLTDFIKEDITKKSFDKEVDSEAKSVTLTGTVNFTTLTYKKSDAIKFAHQLLDQKYSKDQINDQNIVISISGLKEKSDVEMSGVAEIKAGLIPNLQMDKIAQSITGKSFVEANDIAKKIDQVKSANVTLSPNLPFLPKLLPRLSKNIKVMIKTE